MTEKEQSLGIGQITLKHLKKNINFGNATMQRFCNLSHQEKNGDVKTYTYTYAKDELPDKSTHPDGNTTHTYKYDSEWKDKLISYDQFGSP